MSTAGLFLTGRNAVQLFCRNLMVRSSRCQVCAYSQVNSTEKVASEMTEVKLSDRCVKKLKSFGEDENCVRVVVEGGGCSGFQYKFELESAVGPDDRVYERDGVKVIVDTESLQYLKGSTIDYEEELIRSSFRVMDNPQAEQGCSCGVSFSLK